MTSALMSDGGSRDNIASQPFERQSRWRQKRSPPIDCIDDQECLSKRFASEEVVAAHLRELHISPLYVNHMSHTHPLMVTAVTGCPGHIPNEHYITGNNGTVSNIEQYPWQQVSNATVSQEWDNELLKRESSSLTLIDDPSARSSGSWQRGEEMCPPMYPVRAQPSSEEIWRSELRGSPSLVTNHLSADAKEEMTFDTMQNTDISNLATHSMGETPSSSKREPCSLPLPWTHWRQVSMDDVSSDSSDGGNDGPERPLSMWIAPELIQYTQRMEQPVPQSLLEKYNKQPGMELVLWVDSNERLRVGCEESKGAANMTEPLDSEMC